MKDVTSQNFGLLIAYLLPGFTVLWGVSHASATVQSWIGDSTATPTVGGFLYVTVASLAAGLTLSTLRWLLIDTLHHWTGIRKPAWNLTLLGDRISAFNTLIEIHYKFHQFYGAMVIAMPVALVLRWTAIGLRWTEVWLLLALILLFWAGSRDALRKYIDRVDSLLSQ